MSRTMGKPRELVIMIFFFRVSGGLLFETDDPLQLVWVRSSQTGIYTQVDTDRSSRNEFYRAKVFKQVRFIGQSEHEFGTNSQNEIESEDSSY